jgi:protease secretion system outer membrane protein
MTMRQTTARHHRPSFRLSPLWLCGLLTLGTAGLPFRAAHALDLRQSYEAAIGADPRLAAARATAAAAEERLPQAWSQLLPNVSFSANEAQNLLDTTRPNPLTGEMFKSTDRYVSTSGTLSLRQTIFRLPQSLNVTQAGFLVNDARFGLNLEVQNAGVRLSAAYFDALLATDQLALIEAQKISTTTGLDAAQKALLAGSGTRTDVDQAQTRLDTVLAQEIEARQHVDFTRRTLQTLIGRAPDTLAALDPARLQRGATLSESLEDLINAAADSSPEIRSLRARVEASRIEVDKATAGHYPTLDLVGQVSKSQSENVTNPFAAYFNRSIGVQLNVPIYSGGYITSVQRQAAAQLQNAQALLDAGLLEIGLKVQREYRGVTEGVAKLRALEQTVSSAKVALDSTRKSYKAGVRTLLNVLDADQELKSSERNLVQARYTYIMSRIRLAALLGNAVLAIEETNTWLN